MIAASVGATVWWQKKAIEYPLYELATGPRSLYMIKIASHTLRQEGPEFLKIFLKSFEKDRFPQVYVVDNNKKEILNRPVPEITFTRAQKLLNENSDLHIVRKITLADGTKYVLFVPKSEARFDDIRHPPKEPTSPFLVPILLGVIASLGCSAFLAWYFSKPIRHLRWALDAVSAGNLETRVAPLMDNQRDEIADLGRNFDHMAQKIQQLVGSQKRLLHDVSHELRSPLARLQAVIGLARQQPDKMQSYLERIEQEVTRFDLLVGELLTLSRLESKINENSDEYFDLMEMINAIAEDARFEAETHHRHLIFEPGNEVLIQGRAKLLYRAIENVIRNAIKYTPEHTSVTVEINTSHSQYVVISVTDQGLGIPEQDIEMVFEPFYRSQSQISTAGYGLGLAIARRAIIAHGGLIKATNRPEKGLRVDIQLPIATSKES